VLASPQLLPTILATESSYRGSGLPLVDVQAISFQPLRVIEYVIPFFFGALDDYGTALRGVYGGKYPWSIVVFVGIPLLAGYATRLRHPRREWWLHVLVLGGFALALGRYTPVYGLAHSFVPGFALFRHPEKYLLWVHFGMICAGSCGLATCGFRRPRLALRRWVLVIGGMVLAAGLAVIVLWRIYPEVYAGWLREGGSHWPALRFAGWQLLQVCGVVLSCLLLAGVLSGGRPAGPVVFAVTAIHLLVLTFAVHWTIPVAWFRDLPTAAAHLPVADTSQYRVFADLTDHTTKGTQNFPPFIYDHLRSSARLAINAPALAGVRSMTGFSPVGDPDYVDYTDFGRHNPPLIMDLCAVKYLILNGLLQADSLPPDHTLVAEDAQFQYTLIKNPFALPRIYTTDRHLLVPPEESVETALQVAVSRRRSGALDLPPVVLTERPRDWFENTTMNAARGCRILCDDPGRITVACEGPVWLVVRDWLLPGWRACLQTGEKLDLLRADGGMMAVHVPLGEQTVHLRYTPPGLVPGLLLAVTGFCGLLFYNLRPGGKKKAGPSA